MNAVCAIKSEISSSFRISPIYISIFYSKRRYYLKRPFDLGRKLTAIFFTIFDLEWQSCFVSHSQTLWLRWMRFAPLNQKFVLVSESHRFLYQFFILSEDIVHNACFHSFGLDRNNHHLQKTKKMTFFKKRSKIDLVFCGNVLYVPHGPRNHRRWRRSFYPNSFRGLAGSAHPR